MTATDTPTPDVRTSNPYVGPRSFVEGEKLYGREREINELRSTLLARRIVLLYSPSGAGKTSLVQAGLRPELDGQGFQIWPTARVIYEPPPDLDRSRQPNRYLFSTLMSLEEGRPSDQRLGWVELVEASCDRVDALDRYLADRAVEDRNPFLIFDQFEELFTLDPADWDQKQAFLDGLGQTLRDRSRWALISMREDYIAQLDPYLDLFPTRFASRYRLDLLEAADAMKAAKGPAIDAGVGFTDQAAERLVEDLRTVLVQHGEETKSVEGRYVEPVQLQVACHRLWSTLDPHDDEIGIDDVEKVGSADEALADFYSEAVRSVAEDTGTSEAAIRTWVETKLITVDGFRSQTREGPEKSGPEVLHGLQSAHVIRADRRLGSTWYELSHDRLVKPIRDSNKEWLDDHLSTLQRARQEWVRNGRRGLLLSGEVLAEAEAWERNQPEEAQAEDREYLEVCREAERRLALERKVSRRNRLLALVALIIGVLAVFGALVAFALQRRAREAEGRAEDALEQKEQAEASQKALNDQNRYLAEADQAADTDQKLERWWIAQAADSRTDTADLTRKMVAVEHYLEHDPVYVANAFDLDRTGRRLARVISDGAVEIIDVVTLERQPMTDLSAGAEAVSFSPTDDRLMVVGFGENGRWISVFDLAGRDPPVQLDTAGVGLIHDVRLSGSAGIVAGINSAVAGDAGDTIVVWDASTGQRIEAPPGQNPFLVAVSGDGSTVASADDDGQLQAWRRSGDAWTTVALPDVLAEVDTASPLALSADGRAVAYQGVGADPDDRAGTFVVVDGSLPPTTVQLDRGRIILSAVFLPDGTLRTLDDAGAVRTWNRANQGWQEDLAALRNLPPNIGAALNAQGTTAVVRAVQGIAIYDVDSGEQWMGQHAASHGVVRDDRAATVRSSAGAGSPSPGAVYLMAQGQTWEPVGDRPMAGSVFMDLGGQAVAWISTPSDSANAADVQIGVHTASQTSTLPGACGGSASDSVAVASPRDESLPTLVLSSPDGVCYASPDGTSPVVELSPGEVPRAVALAEDETLVVGMDVNGIGRVVAYDAEGYPSDAWLGAPLTALRAPSGQTSLAVGGDEQGNIVVLDADNDRNVCDVKLPVANPVIAVDVIEHDGARFVASATAKAVYVHRITTTGDCNAELQSGFDLQREDGEVLDLSFRPDGTVAVLESDLFLFAFDPAATPADVASRVSALADRRGWKIPRDVGE